MSGVFGLFNQWIGQDDSMPFCLLISTDATRDTPEHLAPFLPETGDAWTLDVLIGPPEYVGRGIARQMLESFLSHVQHQNPTLRTVLIDPEANNSRAIHVYEKVGFQIVSEFVPSDGAFQGQPHVLMTYHYYQTNNVR
jgi:aminoglycoside 6'-N-acetyltransferase